MSAQATTAPASVVRRLQLGFFLSAFVLSALVALVVEVSLIATLDEEDSLLINGVAAELAKARVAGLLDADSHTPQAVPMAWRVQGERAETLLQTPSFSAVAGAQWPLPDTSAVEREHAGHAWLMRAITVPGTREVLQVALDRTVEVDLLWRHRLIAALAVFAGGLVSLLFGRRLADRGFAPLRRIADAAASIGPDQPSMRLREMEFPLELQEVVARLNAAFERLHAGTVALDAVGADIAHELRTPLNLLRLRLEGIMIRHALQPDTAAALGDALEDVDRMASLIEHLLFLARIEHGQGEVRLEQLSVADKLHRVAQFFVAAAEEAEIALQVEAQPEVTLRADKNLLQRALHNLVANALRHAPPGTVVVLSGKVDGDEVVLAVDDQGPGIPQSVLERLGERFVRSDPSRGRLTGGSGLGLAIAGRVAAVHHGRLVGRPGPGGHVALHLPTAGPRGGW